MKRLSKIFLLIFIFLVLLLGITGCKDNENQNNSEPIKELTIEQFKNALEENGLIISKEISKASGMIGAIEGYGYEINGKVIEIYKFDEKSANELSVENIKSIKENGKITIPSFNYTINAVYNDGLVLINYEEHPDNEKIVSIFKELK